jgi:hypothetical protein
MFSVMRKGFLAFVSFFTIGLSFGQTTDVYTSSTTWVVPAGVNSIAIKVYGGGGGTGGQDCGAGCSNAAAGNAGYVDAVFSVTPGDVVGIYPGGRGTNGSNSVTNTGGGAGGVASYSAAYNGGNGGDAGPAGSSGGGGGGGAASVVTINSTIRVVAGGAAGGGGMANQAGSGFAGNNTYIANGTSNSGGNGSKPGGDGGGGGGGGGGQFGAIGGALHVAGGEQAGDGGHIGGNLVSSASSVTTNGNIAWTVAGRIEITYISTLPVSWLGFTANRQTDNSVLLSWSTSQEINTRDFTIQRSVNGTDWTNLGTIPAAGNSQTQINYEFRDAQPSAGTIYYRIAQRDIDGRMEYSRVITLRNTGKKGVKISPNPVTGSTAIITLQQSGIVAIYNSQGRLVLKKEFPAGDSPLDLSGFARGAYHIKMDGDSFSFIIR